MESIGTRIRRIREQKNLSQVKFAEALNTSQTTIVKWESDKSMPSVNAAIKIAKFGGVTTDWLLTGNGKPIEVEYEVNANELSPEDYDLIQQLKKLPITKDLVIRFVNTAQNTKQTVEELKKYITDIKHSGSSFGNTLGPDGLCP